MIQQYDILEKGKPMKTVAAKASGVGRGWAGGPHFCYDTIMADTCHDALSKPMECTTQRVNPN